MERVSYGESKLLTIVSYRNLRWRSSKVPYHETDRARQKAYAERHVLVNALASIRVLDAGPSSSPKEGFDGRLSPVLQAIAIFDRADPDCFVD